MDDHKQRGRRLNRKKIPFYSARSCPWSSAFSLFRITSEALALSSTESSLFHDCCSAISISSDLGWVRPPLICSRESRPENAHKVPELIWTSLSLLVGLGIIGATLSALFVPVSVTHFFKMPYELAGQLASPFLSSVPPCPSCWATMLCEESSKPLSAFDLVITLSPVQPSFLLSSLRLWRSVWCPRCCESYCLL